MHLVEKNSNYWPEIYFICIIRKVNFKQIFRSMDVSHVLSLLQEDDSAIVRSYSSECLDLLDSNESPDKQEVSDEEVPPKSKVFISYNYDKLTRNV